MARIVCITDLTSEKSLAIVATLGGAVATRSGRRLTQTHCIPISIAPAMSLVSEPRLFTRRDFGASRLSFAA